MKTQSFRPTWTGSLRWPEKLRLPFYLAITGLSGLALLWWCSNAVLRTRSLKYLLAYIVAAVIGCAFLMLPRKFEFFLFLSSFSLPFYIMAILFQRDEGILAVTGTTLICLLLAVVGFSTGAMGKPVLLVPRIAIPMLIFVVTCFLSLVNTTDQTLTLIAVAQELEMLFFFLVLVNAITDKFRLVIFLRGLFLAFAIECLIYYIQNLLGFSFDIVGNRKWSGQTDLEQGSIGSQRGTFDSMPATAAMYFSMLTLLLTGLYLSRKKLATWIKPILGMMLGGSCLVLAAKRAPLSGFVLAVIVMFFLLPRRSPWAVRKLAVVAGALAIPALALLPFLVVRASANHEAAYEERANLTKVAWNMYHDHPVIGVGFGTYDTVKRQYLPPDWKGWLFTVHTRYLLVLAETGAVGFAAMILLYLMVLRCAHRGIAEIAPEFRPLQIALVAVMVALLWEQVWDIFNSRQQGYLFWLVAALGVVFPRVLRAPADSARPA